jgi:hypothetical protein
MSNRHLTHALALSGGAIGLALVACTAGQGAALPTPSEPESVVVLHTNDTWGETEPCG